MKTNYFFTLIKTVHPFTRVDVARTKKKMYFHLAFIQIELVKSSKIHPLFCQTTTNEGCAIRTALKFSVHSASRM